MAAYDDILLLLTDFDSGTETSAESIVSMKRNIGVSLDPDFRADLPTARHDMVLDIVCVMRIPSWIRRFLTQQDGKIDRWEVTRAICANAARVLDMFEGAARAFYVGDLGTYAKADYEVYPLPLLGDTTVVTAFGNVIDQDGRMVSLTVTDRSKAESVAFHLAGFAELYDHATSISSGVDYNFGGEAPYRGTVYGDAVRPISSNRKGSKPVTVKDVAVEEPTSDEVHELATFEDVKAVKNGSWFIAPVSRIALNDNGMVINGFNAEMNPIRSVFFFVPVTSEFGKWATAQMDAAGKREIKYTFGAKDMPQIKAIKRVKNNGGKWETNLENAVQILK